MKIGKWAGSGGVTRLFGPTFASTHDATATGFNIDETTQPETYSFFFFSRRYSQHFGAADQADPESLPPNAIHHETHSVPHSRRHPLTTAARHPKSDAADRRGLRCFRQTLPWAQRKARERSQQTIKVRREADRIMATPTVPVDIAVW